MPNMPSIVPLNHFHVSLQLRSTFNSRQSVNDTKRRQSAGHRLQKAGKAHFVMNNSPQKKTFSELRVLIVEDRVGESFKNLLQFMRFNVGTNVILVKTYEEAHQALLEAKQNNTPYDLILQDFELGELALSSPGAASYKEKLIEIIQANDAPKLVWISSDDVQVLQDVFSEVLRDSHVNVLDWSKVKENINRSGLEKLLGQIQKLQKQIIEQRNWSVN